MARFRRIVPLVEAIQLPRANNGEWINDKGERKSHLHIVFPGAPPANLEIRLDSKGRLCVDVAEGYAYPTDWIFRESGVMKISPDHVFRENFEPVIEVPVEQEEGHARTLDSKRK